MGACVTSINQNKEKKNFLQKAATFFAVQELITVPKGARKKRGRDLAQGGACTIKLNGSVIKHSFQTVFKLNLLTDDCY